MAQKRAEADKQSENEMLSRKDEEGKRKEEALARERSQKNEAMAELALIKAQLAQVSPDPKP